MTEKEVGGHRMAAVGLLGLIGSSKAACVVAGELGSGDLWGGLKGRRGLKT